MQQELETSQASYEIQPRVFYEDFKNMVLYVQDVRSGAGASNWRQVFMADVTDPATPAITTAASATVTNDSTQELLMRLRDGSRHEMVANQPQQYNISTFATTDMPLQLSQQSAVQLGRLDTAPYALPMPVLLAHTHGRDAKRFQIEWHNRFAFPGGVPGVDAGGSSAGGCVASRGQELRIRVYDSAGVSLLHSFLHGDCAGQAGEDFAAAGRMVSQFDFCPGGSFSAVADGLRRTDSGGNHGVGGAVSPRPRPVAKPNGQALAGMLAFWRRRSRPVKARNVFPRILDEYVVREFLTTFVMVLAGFVMLMLIFTLFELVGRHDPQSYCADDAG